MSKYRVLLWDLSLSLLSALLLVFAFPKFNYGVLAWIALVPHLLALRGKNPQQAFMLSYCMGIAFLMGIYYWINVLEKFEFTDFILLGLFLGSFFGLFGLAVNFISRKTRFPLYLSAPCIWVSLEYLRSQGGFLALPWPFLGYSQFLNLPLIQIASLTGVYGVSFLIVLINAAVSEIVLRYVIAREKASPLAVGGVVAAMFVGVALVGLSLLYGFYAMAKTSQHASLRVAVIQGNIPQVLRWNPRFRQAILNKHAQLSRQAAKLTGVSLIIWPETTVQGSLARNNDLLNTFVVLSKDSGAHVLVGGAERPKFSSTEPRAANGFNSAFLIAPKGRIVGRYDKIRLLPFGEYLPLKKLPWPSRIASEWSGGEFKPGNDYALLSLDGVKLAVTICWENIFPDLFRQFVKQGANLAVNITNEAWFGETAAPYQFMAMSVFRAVENRISIARAANTGVSGFIDPFGRILGTVKSADKDIFIEGYLVENVPLAQTRTFYTNYGDLFATACVVFSLAMAVFAFYR